MKNIIEIECPQEILLGLHLNSNQFSEYIKKEIALSLYREGKISSGMGAKWLGINRVSFLWKAMQEGNAVLLEDDEDDYKREKSLL
jgi:hypothetical protein